VRVLKRDGKSLEPYSQKEIRKALLMAFSAIGSVPNTTPIEGAVTRHLHMSGKGIVNVDDVLDGIETVLMDSGYYDVAKSFILYRGARNKARAKRAKPDAGALKDYIHVSKYARYLPAKKRRELRLETIDRLEDMHLRRYPELADEIRNAFGYVRDERVSPSMRSMQFGGAAIEKHHARMYNCCFTHIDRMDVFSKVFYLLLCGCGVGYSVQEQHVAQLPVVKNVDRRRVVHHIIEDSIEGWSDAIEVLMWHHFNGGSWVEFSYHKIRDEGSLLLTSGGKAPGHLALRDTIEAVRSILMRCAGRQLRPIDCHDILCHLSIAVLSGGIRRAAMIALFTPSDTEMVYCKAKGNYDVVTGLNAQRQMANNSAVYLRSNVVESEFRRGIHVAEENYGDPGFIFVNDLDHGCNPCGEIGLYPVLWSDEGRKTGFAFCNLTSINCAKFEGDGDFYKAARAAAFIGTIQAGYTSFPYLGAVSEAIAARDALIGVSLNGMMDRPSIACAPLVQQAACAIVNNENIRVAALIGIRSAARTTTVKPEGTNALALGGIASGAHPHHAPRHLRRVTGNVNEPPVKEFMRINPHMVEQKADGNVCLVFPVEAPDGAICLADVTALEHVEMVMSTYENWVVPGTLNVEHSLTHNVSCTVSLMPGEKDAVIDYVWENRHRIAAMTFVPGGLDKLYPYAPREAIVTEEDETYWNRLIAGYRAVDWAAFVEDDDATSRQMAVACAGPEGC